MPSEADLFEADSSEQVVGHMESRARRLFWGSLLLSVLIALHSLLAAGEAGGVAAILSSFLPAVILWSLVLTGYSFFSVMRIATERVKRLSSDFTDMGTGVFSLHYLESCLEHEHRRAMETGTAPAVVAYLDLVNLERVNQEFGYAVGDIVLRSVAETLAENVRRGDVVGRVGGDEFLIIMPETTLARGQVEASRIADVIEAFNLDLGKRGVIDYLSARVGLALFPNEGESPQDIVQAARSKLRPMEPMPV
jgi:diguanylate cyclase (GGDEF)-like protein